MLQSNHPAALSFPLPTRVTARASLSNACLPLKHRYTDGDEEDIALSSLPQYLVKPLEPLPEAELQRPRKDKVIGCFGWLVGRLPDW